ncbi:MAG: ATP-binding protein [Bryobacteraceae bacterium]|jgi:two-component system sensor histidine kinase KdpD
MKALRFAASLALVVAIIAVYRLIPVNNTTVALTLLLAILGISAWWGLAEATLASVLAVLGFNFYFLPPVGKLTIQDPENLVAFFAFLVTATTASQLSARARRRAAEAETRRLESERLYALVRSLALTGNPRKTIREFLNRVVQEFGCRGAAFFDRQTDEIFRTGPESQPVTDHDLKAAAEIEHASGEATGDRAATPVRLGMRSLGSLGLVAPLPSAQMVRAIADLAAITVEKARAMEEASHAEAARQSELLKSALLDSLAHDIKTPLTSIKAAVTSLLGEAAATDRELLTIINEEADRLNQLAAEVVAMARIEAGKLHLEKRDFPVEQIVTGALAEVEGLRKGRPIAIHAPAGLPAAEADPELAQQVVKQFLENALKYTPDDTPITVSVERKSGKIVVGVADRGPGIEEHERALIFDRFYRGREQRFRTKGTGMGLAIAKGIVEAHGERIWVESERRQGSVFYFTLAAAGGKDN